MKYTPAKTCYSHLGGKLGELMMQMMVNKKWISKAEADKHYHITPKGEKELERLGIDVSQIKQEEF